MTLPYCPNIACYTEPMDRQRSDDIPSTFTNEDRRVLTKVDTELRYLKEDIDQLGRDFRSLSSPTKADFSKLEGKVEALENFRWYLMGIAIGAATLIHFIFGKL